MGPRPSAGLIAPTEMWETVSGRPRSSGHLPESQWGLVETDAAAAKLAARGRNREGYTASDESALGGLPAR
ncbi:hypothetical protein GCM10010361_44950 [Streptomyces olivaceiscleroticus]|uniref:Uncharacterized protein n=1 Tax=Streptomyces olivaceiscleroticus TaxID=68245 RepID=A0ABN1AFX5_9ACTN